MPAQVATEVILDARYHRLLLPSGPLNAGYENFVQPGVPSRNDLLWPRRIQISPLTPPPGPGGDDSDHSWQTRQDQLCPCNWDP